jgi:type IV pilus assembly protein PilQ
LSLKDADLRELLRSFAKLGCFNLVLDPGVQGEVTVELHDVPWDQALSVILKTHGLAAEEAGLFLQAPRGDLRHNLVSFAGCP